VEEASSKSSLKYLNIKNLEIGKCSNVWNLHLELRLETRKAIVKARMMTGSYILQINKHKFNNNSIDQTCPLCKADDETIIHLITTCPILSDIREKHFTIIKETILKKLTSQTWTERFNTKLAITKLVIDSTSFEGCIGNDNVLMNEIDKHTTNFLFQLHVTRLNVIRDQSQD
jgi:hypothetical protein